MDDPMKIDLESIQPSWKTLSDDVKKVLGKPLPDNSAKVEEIVGALIMKGEMKLAEQVALGFQEREIGKVRKEQEGKVKVQEVKEAVVNKAFFSRFRLPGTVTPNNQKIALLGLSGFLLLGGFVMTMAYRGKATPVDVAEPVTETVEEVEPVSDPFVTLESPVPTVEITPQVLEEPVVAVPAPLPDVSKVDFSPRPLSPTPPPALPSPASPVAQQVAEPVLEIEVGSLMSVGVVPPGGIQSQGAKTVGELQGASPVVVGTLYSKAPVSPSAEPEVLDVVREDSPQEIPRILSPLVPTSSLPESVELPQLEAFDVMNQGVGFGVAQAQEIPAIVSQEGVAPAPTDERTNSLVDVMTRPDVIHVAQLVTGVVVTDNSASGSPVLAEADTKYCNLPVKCPVMKFFGRAFLEQGNYLKIVFTHALVGDVLVEYNAVALNTSREPLLKGVIVQELPAAAADLVTGALRGVSSYVQDLQNSTSITYEDGRAIKTDNAADLVTSIFGSAASTFQLPATTVTMVRVVKLEAGTDIMVYSGLF
jgi:hypothetical protein